MFVSLVIHQALEGPILDRIVSKILTACKVFLALVKYHKISHLREYPSKDVDHKNTFNVYKTLVAFMTHN